MNKVIEAINVCKTYGEQRVSKNIDLAVAQGSIYGLLGPNGAGKTTLIRMLSTITQPDSGEILFKGEPLRESHAQQMGYMPEERGLYKKMTVADQLVFFAELRGLSTKDAKASVKHWLQRLDMMDWARKKVEEISKGMAQKVQFVSCVLHNPQLLILDEPTSAIDAKGELEFFNNVYESHRGKATLIVSHRFSTVRTADTIIVLDGGAIVDFGSHAELMQRGGLYKEMFDIQAEGYK